MDCRKAHRQTAKQLVESAHEVATVGCMTEHSHRRTLAARMLEALPQAFSAEPLGVAKFRELAFAALAYARDEVIWYFLHVNEVNSAHHGVLQCHGVFVTSVDHFLLDGDKRALGFLRSYLHITEVNPAHPHPSNMRS